MKEVSGKRGQVTLFVILAIVIVVAGVLIYFFYPGITSTSMNFDENPNTYFQNCVEDSLEDNLILIGSQGGSIEPKGSFTYMGEEVEYLCYTNQYYAPCVVQRAALVSSMESELKDAMMETVDDCYSQMRNDYSSKGYEVNLDKKDFSVNLLPNEVDLESESVFEISKSGTQRYEGFSVVVDNNIYELASISRGIVAWEVAYGDAEVTMFMDYFPNVKVEKFLQSDGTKIYVLTDRETGDKFQFASRSIVWPAGIVMPEA